MDHALTGGMVVRPLLVILGFVIVVGGLIWVLSIFASGFNH